MSSDAVGALTGEVKPTPGLVPKLRFPEFRDAGPWMPTPFDKVLLPVSREIEKPDLSYTGLGLRSHGRGTFRKPEQNPDKNVMDRLYVVHRDDLVVNITFAWEGAIAIAGQDDHGCYVSHRFPTYEFRKGVSSPEFFRYVITDKTLVYQLGVISPGGAGRNRVLNKNGFLRLTTLLPKPTEQQKIANCLSSVDALIAAEWERLAALRDYKKGLMQRLFPRPERIEHGEKIPAETTPRLRFPEFQNAGEWEWTTVDAIAQILKGKGISKADISADGQQPCVRYGELYTTYGEVVDEVVSRTNVARSELFMSRKNDVVIPSSGETKIDIATAACVLHDDIALGGDLNVVRSRHNGIFLSYFLNGPLKNTIARIAQGDSVVHLYPTQIGSLKIALPSMEEQRRIADTIFAVERVIVAQRRRLLNIKAHKSGLMQQLFPPPAELSA